MPRANVRFSVHVAAPSQRLALKVKAFETQLKANQDADKERKRKEREERKKNRKKGRGGRRGSEQLESLADSFLNLFEVGRGMYHLNPKINRAGAGRARVGIKCNVLMRSGL